SVDKDGAEHRLTSIGEDRLLAAAAAVGLASAHQDELAELPVLRDLGAGLGAHQLIVAPRKLPFARLGKACGQELGNGEPENAVAQEFEPLIVLVWLERRACARMRERKLDQRAALESITQSFEELCEGRIAPIEHSSTHRFQNARPADVGRAFPDLHKARILIDGEEDDLGATDRFLEGQVADL